MPDKLSELQIDPWFTYQYPWEPLIDLATLPGILLLGWFNLHVIGIAPPVPWLPFDPDDNWFTTFEIVESLSYRVLYVISLPLLYMRLWVRRPPGTAFNAGDLIRLFLRLLGAFIAWLLVHNQYIQSNG